MSEPIRVLHVDDDPGFAEVAADFLEREDGRFTAETVPSASEGLDRLANGTFDCVVSDHDMPETNGIEFLEAVREEDPDLPFILFTGKGSEEAASRAISAGVTDYIVKGTDTSQYAVLAHRIENAVEQYRSRRAVEATRRTLEQLTEKTDDVLFMFSGDWSELLFINSSYEDVWGGSTAELRSDPESFLEYVHPEDRGKARRSMERLSNGEPDVVEYRVTSSDGERRWVRGESKPILDDDGSVERIVGFVRDITEQRKRERELREKSNLLDQIFTQVPIHLYVKDEDGRHLRVSEHLVDDPGEYLGRTDREIFPDAFGEEAHADDMEVIETGEPLLNREEYLPTREEWHLTSKVPWYDDDGELAGLLGVTWDISERKTYERELERQNERLEEFGSVVSHELRNPLNIAEGQLELARAECDSDHLDDAATAIDRIVTLIGDLLALAREGEAASEVEPVELADAVEASWRNVETAAATLVGDADGTIQADPSRLKQLFENLFRNAVEHSSTSPPGSREGAVGPCSTGSQASPDDVAERSSAGDRTPSDNTLEHGDEVMTITVGDLPGGFYVEDDGPGIPEGERDAVFETGYSTTEEGTGFGLSIVNEIVEAHGWEIDLTESDSGGARFEITGVDTVA